MHETLRLYYLKTMGITPWRLKKHSINDNELYQCQQAVASCTRCVLSKTRTHTVFAKGPPNAELMIVGEAPSFHDDKQGIPFMGRAGQMLDKMLESVGIDAKASYMTPIIKCYPPDNRDPEPDELLACSEYLIEQINTVKPKVILAVGRSAANSLLDDDLPLNSMRGVTHNYKNIPLIVSYHPAHLLRHSIDKKKAYQDLLQIKSLLTP